MYKSQCKHSHSERELQGEEKNTTKASKAEPQQGKREILYLYVQHLDQAAVRGAR